MFTGIIEEVGHVRRIVRNADAMMLEIGADLVLDKTRRGDSICVSGVCLTVVSLCATSFCVDVMPETLSRSSFKKLTVGNVVNLERAMPADGRFGGHFVSGHIDGTGCVSAIRRDANAIWYSIEAPSELTRYIVEKGSIAVDGISLTVAWVDKSSFSVSTIPHTNEATTLPMLQVGDAVNLECDIIGKYVEKLVQPQADDVHKLSTLTLEKLAEKGF